MDGQVTVVLRVGLKFLLLGLLSACGPDYSELREHEHPAGQGGVNVLSLAGGDLAPLEAPWQARDDQLLRITSNPDLHAGADDDVRDLAMAAITETVLPCSGGGTETLTQDNIDPPWFSAGDTFTTTFDQCLRGNTLYNGQRIFAVDDMVGMPYVDPQWSITTTISRVGFTRSNQLNGEVTLSEGSATTELTGSQVAGPFQVEYLQRSFGGWNRSRPNQGTEVTSTSRFDITYGWDNSRFTWEFDVSLSSSLFGDTEVVSLEVLSGQIGMPPDSGQFRATKSVAAATSIQLVTVLGNGQVQVETDSDGDGVVDNVATMDWFQVMLEPILYQFF